MKPFRWVLLSVAVLVMASLACSPFGGSTTEEQPTPETVKPTFPPTRTPVSEATATLKPPAEATPEPTPETDEPINPAVSGAALLITNYFDITVWYLYISPSDSSEWGDDRLGDDVIGPGESYVITDIPEGTYDLKAEDEYGNMIEGAWEMELVEDVAWTISGESIASIDIINESGEPIYYLNVSPVDNTEWGDDVLGDDIIEPGMRYTLSGFEPGYYDLRALDSDAEGIETAYSFAILGESDWLVTGSASVPSNAVLRFEEDFADNHNNWGNVDTENTNYMAPAGGEYCILVRTEDNTAWEWYEPFRTDEFVAEVQCYVDGPQDASCGLGFGPDADNLYWFEVSAYDQTFALFLLENDEWQEMPIEWTASTTINPDGPNALGLGRVDDIFTVYINGVVVGEVRGDRFPEGRVGLGGSTYNDPNATVCLDNLRVWRLE